MARAPAEVARTWAEAASALRDHPDAKAFVPVAMYHPHSPHQDVPIFPIQYRRWAKRFPVRPRPPELRATYASRAVALLEEHWPLERGEPPDVKGAGAIALRFVIYFAERDIPPERHHEFLLAQPMYKLLLQMKTHGRVPTFDEARAFVARRMREWGGGPSLVLRQLLRSLKKEGVTPAEFHLNLALHDSAHVLSACERVLVGLKVWRLDRSLGTGEFLSPVRVAWPGLLLADDRLHLLWPKKAYYACAGSLLPLVRPGASSGARDERSTDPRAIASFNIAVLQSMCETDDVMLAARTHYAPALHPPRAVLPHTPLRLDDILPEFPRGPTPPPPVDPPPFWDRPLSTGSPLPKEQFDPDSL